jgi:hypothetical protein
MLWHMAMAPPGDDRPPEGRDLADPVAYRAHVVDIMQRAFALARRFQRRGDAYALATILLSFSSSAVGFVTAAVDLAPLGVIPGVLGAAGGALASWSRRAHFDALASSNRMLSTTLEQEIREFDAHAGAYTDDDKLDEVANSKRRFRLFVERCERAAVDANVSTESLRSP